MANAEENNEQAKIDHILASSGFVFPRTEQELDNFNMFYSDEDYNLGDYIVNPSKLIDISKSFKGNSSQDFISENKKNTYFKRAVLAAEIASQLYQEPTFGHVKFQKIVFLCENIQGMNINFEYSKQAAGPYDNKFMHSIDYELKKQKWFEVKKEKKGSKSHCRFIPLENFDNHKKYYTRYFSQHHEKIQWFIDAFRKARTYKVELIATLYACWMELKKKNKTVSEETLISLLYAWSKEKEKYSQEVAVKAINWMKVNSVFPT